MNRIDATDITPGALFLWRAHRVGGERIAVASYREGDGQLLWIAEPSSGVSFAPRALAVLVSGEQVLVRSVAMLFAKPGPRVVLEVLTALATPTGAPSSLAGVPEDAITPYRVEIPIATLMDRIRAGAETVEGTRVTVDARP